MLVCIFATSYYNCLLMNDKGAPEQNAPDALHMKLCLLFQSDLVPRWLETYYFLSLGKAEFDGRWADCIPSLDSFISDKYARPHLQSRDFLGTYSP